MYLFSLWATIFNEVIVIVIVVLNPTFGVENVISYRSDAASRIPRDIIQAATIAIRRPDRQTSIRVSFNAIVSVVAPSLSLDHVCGTVSL